MLSIELNELNKNWIDFYVGQGKLPMFKSIFEENNLIITKSESKYEQLEPWIQWPSFYSGQPFTDHKCFHIGDFYKNKTDSIYEDIQKKNLSVLAISPMNCYFSEKNNSFFLPDPWEEFEIKGNSFLKTVFKSICKKVNSNATGNLGTYDYLKILCGFFVYARFKNYPKYLKLALRSLKYKWYQAIFLDVLLVDIFINLNRKNYFAYSSIFLNAGAHIQHHHLYDSDCYHGENINPESYSRASSTNVDPIYEVLSCYDDLLKDLIKLSEKFMVTTGLSQIENPSPYHQYRFRDFDKFLNTFEIKCENVIPRMSRDFTIFCKNKKQLEENTEILKNIYIDNNKLFKLDIDEENCSIFAKIAWSGAKDSFKRVRCKEKYFNLLDEVALVSIENSIHSSCGWHLRNFRSDDEFNEEINIWDLKEVILSNI
tara:strand:+ start:9579 stop:10859 length:1281 start_codon:yes stop_codon:yes gene_type:complete